MLECEIPEWVQPGASFKSDYMRLKHVRAIVDGQAVCRFWKRSKHHWQYEVLDAVWFQVYEKHLEIRPAPGPRKKKPKQAEALEEITWTTRPRRG
jgi:hypothetical protein